ncbi:MAG: LemA family protein [Haliscomenobacter sp.]|nr:LemA family protein [Haliscomenobacter sp.]MBK7476574.1 LemA family protein [Haliscomenobacter sp.]MBK8879492.1 LemA family protein [Haliscomenobacter sp.]
MIYAFIALVVIALWGIMLFNRGVRLKNQVEEAWSGISVQLKRRYDLIPNLVNTVKGYASHEQDTLEKVIQLRNQAQSAPAGQINEQVHAEAALSAGIRSIFALAENYPDLKANQNFLDLQQTLTEVEDHLQNARRYYNAVVRDNNNYVDGFPSMIVARLGGFKGFDFFEADEKERGNVEVKF